MGVLIQTTVVSDADSLWMLRFQQMQYRENARQPSSSSTQALQQRKSGRDEGCTGVVRTHAPVRLSFNSRASKVESGS